MLFVVENNFRSMLIACKNLETTTGSMTLYVDDRIEQVPETLPHEVLGKMGAPPKSDVPVISPDQLAEADGLIFGFPTRFGMMAAQFKAFFDATGGLWRAQTLAGKPAGIFYSTGSQGGGQETTA